MATLFNQVKEENFSAKILNWQHSRYCRKIQTILFSTCYLHKTDMGSFI